MKTIEQKRLEYLDETVEYYSTHPRCLNDKRECYYSPEKAGLIGKTDGCAIGRKCSPELRSKLDREFENKSVDVIFSLLPNDLKELDKDFLGEVQRFHDVGIYWDKVGLSEKGRQKYNWIKEQYC